MKEEIENLVRDIVHDELTSIVNNMVAQTQRLVRDLAGAAKANREMYDKHLSSLEKSRDEAQKSLHDLITEIKDMRGDNMELIQAYRAELQSAKSMYCAKDDAYTRLAEKLSGTTTEVTISK